MADDYTTAEIVRTLNRIEEKVDTLSANYLPRTEWQLWAEARDREIKTHKTDTEAKFLEIKVDIEARLMEVKALINRPSPLISYVPIAVSTLSIVIVLIQAITN